MRERERKNAYTSSFDNYLRGHIKTSNKTINIRGLFRVPDVSGGEHLNIITSEKEEQEQRLQIPMSSANIEAWNRLPGMPNESLPSVSKAMMLYPSGKPEFPEPETIEIEEKQPIDYYIDLAKQQPGKKIAVVYGKTGVPRIGLMYDGNKVEMSGGLPAMEPDFIKEGNLKKTIDKIYSIKHPLKFTQKDLPPDVKYKATMYYSSDDDEDPDKGGQKILSKKERKKEELEEEEKIPFSYSGKPKDDDDDDDQGGGMQESAEIFTTPKGKQGRKTSDDYKEEIASLRAELERRMFEMKKYEAEIPNLDGINKDLLMKLEDMEKDLALLREYEGSAKKEREELEREYDREVEAVKRKDLSVKELKEEINQLTNEYAEHIGDISSNYETLLKESRDQIDELKREIEDSNKFHKEQLDKVKKAYIDLEDKTREKDKMLKDKDIEVRNLYKDNESLQTYANELQAELNETKNKYYILEQKLNVETERLNRMLQEQDLQYQSTMSAEIGKLNQYIQNLQAEKNELLADIQQKQHEISELTTDKANALKNHERLIKEKEVEATRLHNQEVEKIRGGMWEEMKGRADKYIDEILSRRREEMERIHSVEMMRKTREQMSKVEKEKDEEIGNLSEQVRRLTEELNQYRYKPGQSLADLSGMISYMGEKMEEEENKVDPPTHGMQTRSKGTPNYGEKLIQEEYDPLGNLTWKGYVYKIPNMGEYNAYDVVVNLLQKATGNNKIFKTNFVNYAQQVEKDLRIYTTDDNMGYITKAVDILKNELNKYNRAIAIAIKHIIEKNPKVLAGFKKIYEKQYAQHLKK